VLGWNTASCEGKDMSDSTPDSADLVGKLAEAIYTEQAAAVRLTDRILAKGRQQDTVPADSTSPRPGLHDEEQYEAAYVQLLRLHEIFAALLAEKAETLGVEMWRPPASVADWILDRFGPAYLDFLDRP
jgi:hypothetical protein